MQGKESVTVSFSVGGFFFPPHVFRRLSYCVKLPQFSCINGNNNFKENPSKIVFIGILNDFCLFYLFYASLSNV
jgi:hypothetical protein